MRRFSAGSVTFDQSSSNSFVDDSPLWLMTATKWDTRPLKDAAAEALMCGGYRVKIASVCDERLNVTAKGSSSLESASSLI
jgi:hypothetical protein